MKNVDSRSQSCYFNKMTFLANLEHSQETFFTECFFFLFFFVKLKTKLQTGNVREKGPFCKGFFENVKILEYLLLSQHFQKRICSGVFNPIVGCRMKSYNFIKRELYYIHFMDIFQSFRCNNFKTPYDFIYLFMLYFLLT